MAETAVFELFVRKPPPERGFLMAAGLEQAVQFLESMRFRPDELAWLRASGTFSSAFLDSLQDLRFTGDVDAMPEGTVFFTDEPLLRVTAPLPQAQLVETRLINLLHFQTVIASKAARMVLAAPGKQLVDFGLRRAHGAEAGLLAARASYLAGFSGTATVLAGRDFGIPIVGTMAHSFVQAHDDEATAFERFARVRPRALTLLIDTYDTERGARHRRRVSPRGSPRDGITISAVRLDSGDLAAHARAVRAILDAAGLQSIHIFASGGLDEQQTAVAVSRWRADRRLRCRHQPDHVGRRAGARLRLQAAGVRRPAATQAQRRQSDVARPQAGLPALHGDGTIAGDVIALVDEPVDGEPLLQPAMRNGKRVDSLPSLAEARAHAAASLAQLPEPLRRLEPGRVPVEISRGIRNLVAEMDQAATRGSAS